MSRTVFKTNFRQIGVYAIDRRGTRYKIVFVIQIFARHGVRNRWLRSQGYQQLSYQVAYSNFRLIDKWYIPNKDRLLAYRIQYAVQQFNIQYFNIKYVDFPILLIILCQIYFFLSNNAS